MTTFVCNCLKVILVLLVPHVSVSKNVYGGISKLYTLYKVYRVHSVRLSYGHKSRQVLLLSTELSWQAVRSE